MKKNNTVVKNIISAILNQVIVIIYGFIVPIIIIKNFGSEVNGLISSIAQFLAYISLLEGGIGPVIKNSLFKPLVDKNNDELGKILGASDNFFKRLSFAFVIYIVILCVIYPNFVDNKYSLFFTISLILIISINHLAEYFFGITYSLFLKADQKNYFIDNLNSISYLFNLFLIVILVKCGAGILLIKLLSSVVYIIKPIIIKIYFKKKYKIKLNKEKKYKFEKQWDGLAHHIAATVQSNTDVMLLTIFTNLINVSIYSVYSLITNGINCIIVSLTNGIDAFFGKKMAQSNSINSSFEVYSFIFYTITTILLSMTLILIVPFIEIYTSSIKDANYIVPLFAYLMVFTEFNFAIRYPYSSIVYANGNFKETSKYAIAEPLVNILVSLLLVHKFGLIGVAIGTLVSTPIRSIGFIYYGATKILKTNFWNSFKQVFVSMIQLIIVFSIYLLVGGIKVNTYFKWFTIAVFLIIPISIFIVLSNALIFNKTFKDILKSLKRKSMINEEFK